VAGISQRIADMTVTAPRAGVITGRTAEPGEVLPAGAPLSVLTDLAEPWLTVYVDQPSLSRFALGNAVEVRVDGRTESFAGRVTFVSPVAEFTPKNVQTPEERAKLVFRVKIALDNRDGVFKPGMPADAYFKGSSQPAADSSQLRTDTAPAHGPAVGGRPTVVASRSSSPGTAGSPLHTPQDGSVVRASCPHDLVRAAGSTALHSVRAGRPHHNVTAA
jgi:pyruvate/2-oxoglutarate dehydrogenase complex dihydrolipoamide acyltransferase (E2) component